MSDPSDAYQEYIASKREAESPKHPEPPKETREGAEGERRRSWAARYHVWLASWTAITLLALVLDGPLVATAWFGIGSALWLGKLVFVWLDRALAYAPEHVRAPIQFHDGNYWMQDEPGNLWKSAARDGPWALAARSIGRRTIEGEIPDGLYNGFGRAPFVIEGISPNRRAVQP